MSALPPIVKVDARGMTADGDDVNVRATLEQVLLGHMVNLPVLAQYPNGQIRDGNLVRLTVKGLEFLKRTMPLEVRRPEGST